MCLIFAVAWKDGCSAATETGREARRHRRKGKLSPAKKEGHENEQGGQMVILILSQIEIWIIFSPGFRRLHCKTFTGTCSTCDLRILLLLTMRGRNSPFKF